MIIKLKYIKDKYIKDKYIKDKYIKGYRMNNYEIIEAVEKIVSPYFKFNIEDFYGDKGSCVYPKIEDLDMLYFKLNGSLKAIIPSKDEVKIMVDKIINLNVGLVDIWLVQAFGRYIVIEPQKKTNAQTLKFQWFKIK